jgi:hypothetical protein
MRRLTRLALAFVLAAVAAGIAPRAGAESTPLSVPADLTVEAEDATGAQVAFTVAAADPTSGEALPLACDHPPGAAGSGALDLTARFPIGATTVTCTTTASGAQVRASFAVTVRDSTPPRLAGIAPLTVEAPGESGAIVAYTPPAAVDAVDGTVAVDCDPPPGSTFRVGVTTVTCVARDSRGNIAVNSFTVTIVPPPAASPPAVTGGPAAPENVKGLKAVAGDALVRLRWTNPAGPFDHVLVDRSAGSAGAPTTVYAGAATTFVDRHVRNGVSYRYELVSVDAAGNRSTGTAVFATPMRELLTSPPDGAKLLAPPRLAWVPTPAARYYNVQLFRGTTKILSLWPSTTSLTLARKWLYAGRRQRLIPGPYRWYVWPGFGSRSARRYGRLLGTRSFEIAG